MIAVSDPEVVVAGCRARGVGRGDPLGVALAPGIGVGLAVGSEAFAVGGDPIEIVARLESELRPRWVWWSNDTAAQLLAGGVRIGTCWDLAAVHRLLFGGWQSDPATVWAALGGLDPATIPAMGQLGLLDDHGDDGTDLDQPVRPDGHLRPEWTSGGWAGDPARLARWAATAGRAAARQLDRLDGERARSTARSESAAELLCVELAATGLPIDVAAAEAIIESFVGPRPEDEADERARRVARDAVVLDLAGAGRSTDLRNPADVKALLRRVGIDLPDTRAWRLESLRSAEPLVDALLTWRKAERVATTYGFTWLDTHVGGDGRLRGGWTGSDGAAGRMTAQAGLHNLPGDLRSAVAAEPGRVLVRADLGQIEPRVLAAVSGDPALTQAAGADDLYAPIARRLGVERSVAKIAVLAAMYGQTSGNAGQALRGLEAAYPVAMGYLRAADERGQDGLDVITYGGRRVRMWPTPPTADDRQARAVAAARGRFARNAVVQGAAAELFKRWAVTVRARLVDTGAAIVLCLHDELLVDAPAERGGEVAELLVECLERSAAGWAPASGVRFVADVSVVRRWSDAKS